MQLGSTKTMHEQIDSPGHYNMRNKVETIDIIAEFLTEEEFRGFLLGNIIKYVERAAYKGGDADLQKAKWYKRRLEKEFGYIWDVDDLNELDNIAEQLAEDQK